MHKKIKIIYWVLQKLKELAVWSMHMKSIFSDTPAKHTEVEWNRVEWKKKKKPNGRRFFLAFKHQSSDNSFYNYNLKERFKNQDALRGMYFLENKPF